MFVIYTNEKILLSDNAKQDDILQFMPKHFGCDKKDLKIYWTDSLPEGTIEFVVKDGKVVCRKLKPATKEGEEDKVVLIQADKLNLKKLKKWPYAEDGSFLGNEFEG